MKILRTAALVAVGKKLYDESRKPQNKAKIDRAAASSLWWPSSRKCVSPQ